MDVIERVADYVDVLTPEAVRELITLNVVLAAERVNLRKLDEGHDLVMQRLESEAHRMRALDDHEAVLVHHAKGLLMRTAHVRQVLLLNGGKRVEVPQLPEAEPLRLPGNSSVRDTREKHGR
jgi:hypothetical protein